MSESEILRELGERISQARINAEWTQSELADRAAISLATLSKAERGFPMTTTTLYRILKVFDREMKLADVFPEPVVSPIALRNLKETRKRVR